MNGMDKRVEKCKTSSKYDKRCKVYETVKRMEKQSGCPRENPRASALVFFVLGEARKSKIIE